MFNRKPLQREMQWRTQTETAFMTIMKSMDVNCQRPVTMTVTLRPTAVVSIRVALDVPSLMPAIIILKQRYPIRSPVNIRSIYTVLVM